MAEERTYTISDFSLGHNDTASVVKLDPREGLHTNTNLERDGAVSRRLGADAQLSPDLGVGVEIGLLHYFKPSGSTAKIVIGYGTKLGTFDPVAKTVTELLTGLTNNKVWLAAPFTNLLYLSNGVDPLLVYYPDGTSPYIFKAGMPQPTSGPTFNSDIAGSMGTGTILVRVRWVSKIDDNFIGEPYPEDGQSMTVSASGGVRINLPTYTISGLDYGVAKIQIERTEVGGGTFYEEGLVNNGTSTYDITQSDASLKATGDIVPDLGTRLLPPNPLFPIMKLGKRLIGGTTHGRVDWSEVDEFGILPEAFPSLNYQVLDVEDFQDGIIACAKLGRYGMFYCGRSIHLLFIDDDGSSYADRLVTDELGVTGPRAVGVLPTGHLLWTNKGPYLFTGSDLVFIGEKIEESLSSASLKYAEDAWALHRPQESRRQVVFTTSKSASIPDATWRPVYHYRRPSLAPQGFPTEHAWTFHEGGPWKSGCVYKNDDGEIVEYSGDYDGQVYRDDYLELDDHDPNQEIATQFWTSWMDFGEPYVDKFYQDLWVLLGGGVDYAISVQYEVDFGRGQGGSGTLELGTQGAAFGSAVFGTATFGGTENQIRHLKLASDGVTAVGRYIRIGFSSSQPNQGFQIIALQIGWHGEQTRQDRQGDNP